MPDERPTVILAHGTAPGCHWSWGYEAVINRVRMVYGDQVDVALRLGCPYDDWQQWLVDYGMGEEEALAWLNDEALPSMGVPMSRVKRETVPRTVLPATLAVVAATRQGPEKARRFLRALLRRFAVEAKDPAADAVREDAAREAGLDLAKLRADWRDQEGLMKEYEEIASEGPAVHAGFYNVILWDGGNRKVVLDYAFDPKAVEEAIDYLSGGRFTKARPTDVVGYVREHGAAPVLEIARVFALPEKEALAKLEAGEKSGALTRVTLAGAPHWAPV